MGIVEITPGTSFFYSDFDGFMNGMQAGSGTINFPQYFVPRYANAFNNIVFSGTTLSFFFTNFLHYLTAGNCFNRSRIKRINLNFTGFDMKNLYKYVRNITSWNNTTILEGIRITAYDVDKPVIIAWLQGQLPNVTIQ